MTWRKWIYFASFIPSPIPATDNDAVVVDSGKRVSSDDPYIDDAHESKLPKITQLHLALAGEASRDMRITFRNSKSTDVQVCWSEHGQELTTVASVDKSCSYWEGTHSSAVLSPLKPNVRYSYMIVDGIKDSCENRTELIERRTFKAPPRPEDTINLLAYGDFGYGIKAFADETRHRIELLKNETDLIIHAGDISYCDDSYLRSIEYLFSFNYEHVYDKWLEWMQNVTDHLPYMVSVGNHESECHSPVCMESKEKREKLGNFTAYNCRWHMPSKESKGRASMWYSYDFGPVHFVSLNTETDFPQAEEENYGDCAECGIPAGHFGEDGEYLKWLEDDLKKANKNRKERPWIIAHGHRPLYAREPTQCFAESLCTTVEPLFKKYGVDVYFSGHDHIYSREKPKADEDTLLLVVGSAGSDERKAGDLVEDSGAIGNFDYYYNGNVLSIGKVEISPKEIKFAQINVNDGTAMDELRVEKKIDDISGITRKVVTVTSIPQPKETKIGQDFDEKQERDMGSTITHQLNETTQIFTI